MSVKAPQKYSAPARTQQTSITFNRTWRSRVSLVYQGQTLHGMKYHKNVEEQNRPGQLTWREVYNLSSRAEDRIIVLIRHITSTNIDLVTGKSLSRKAS